MTFPRLQVSLLWLLGNKGEQITQDLPVEASPLHRQSLVQHFPSHTDIPRAGHWSRCWWCPWTSSFYHAMLKFTKKPLPGAAWVPLPGPAPIPGGRKDGNSSTPQQGEIGVFLDREADHQRGDGLQPEAVLLPSPRYACVFAVQRHQDLPLLGKGSATSYTPGREQ